MAINREATLREVLAEVTILDLGSASKKIFAAWGCLIIFAVAAFLLGQLPVAISGDGEGFGIPDWVAWLFVIWMIVAAYTADNSYHDHRFAWYFPKAGFLWSIPLACYFLVGILLFTSIEQEAEFAERVVRLGIAVLYWFPFLLSISLMEIGHNRLMEKRAEGKLDDET